MTKDEMQSKIKSIMFSDAGFGIEMFTCLRSNDSYEIKRLRATDNLLSSTKHNLTETISNTYVSSEIEYDSSENISDNKKAFYEIDQDIEYHPFSFLDQTDSITDYYSEKDRKQLCGFLFRINKNDNYLWIYQHVYTVSRIDRSKHILAVLVKNTYDKFDNEIVQIDSRSDMIIIGSSIITAKIDLLQRFFGFEQYIRAGAKKTIEIIGTMDIVTGLEKFIALENKNRLTNSKKLLKAKNSPVLKMKKELLLERLKNHSRYKTMFNFEDDHIAINSQKDAEAFIKMVNDDILRSELTGQEYNSPSKSLLEPAEKLIGA